MIRDSVHYLTAEGAMLVIPGSVVTQKSDGKRAKNEWIYDKLWFLFLSLTAEGNFACKHLVGNFGHFLNHERLGQE